MGKVNSFIIKGPTYTTRSHAVTMALTKWKTYLNGIKNEGELADNTDEFEIYFNELSTLETINISTLF